MKQEQKGRLDKTGNNIMNKRTYRLIDNLLKQGFGNEGWGLIDCEEGMEAGLLFGTRDDCIISGLVLYVYVQEEDYYRLRDLHGWWSYIFAPDDDPSEKVVVYSLNPLYE